MPYGYITLGEMRAELLNRLQDSGAVYTTVPEANASLLAFFLCCAALFACDHSWSFDALDVLVAGISLNDVADGSGGASVFFTELFHGHFGDFVLLDDLFGLLVCELAVLGALSFVHRGQFHHEFSIRPSSPHSVGPARVLFRCDVFQIVHAIVEAVSVNVVDDHASRSWANEAVCDHAVHGRIVFSSIGIEKLDNRITPRPFSIDAWFEFVKAMNTTIGTHEVVSPERRKLNIPDFFNIVHNTIVPYNIQTAAVR